MVASDASDLPSMLRSFAVLWRKVDGVYPVADFQLALQRYVQQRQTGLDERPFKFWLPGFSSLIVTQLAPQLL